MTLALSSKLEAVNSMLASIGEAPLNQLTAVTADGAIAISTIDEVSRAAQSLGWHFNTDKLVPLVRDSNNNIILDPNTLRIDCDPRLYPSVDVVQRNGKLYDRKNHTFVFSIDLKAEIVRLLDWDDLPQPFRTYVTAKASRVFQQRMVGSSDLGNQLERDELVALAVLKEFDADTADYNVFDAYDVYRVLDRN